MRKTSRALWRSVRQVKPFAAEAARERPLWRISTAPARGHELVDLITPAAQMFYDWAGGLVWVAMPFAHEPDAGFDPRRGRQARRPRHAGARAGLGARRARRVRAAGGGPWPRLSKRVKEGFDPKGVLNPGRMWAGV